MKTFGFAAVIVLVCLGGVAQAQNVLTNGDFTTDLSGWAGGGPGSAAWASTAPGVNGSLPDGTPDGSYLLMTGPWEEYNVAMPAGTSGQQWDLSFNAGSDGSAAGGATALVIRLWWNDGNTALPGQVISDAALNSGWANYTYSFTLPNNPSFDGKGLQITFDSAQVSAGGTANEMIYIDKVSFGQPQVPEPSTVVLLVTGFIGLLAYAWRKRR
jgi:hypothetical protein